MRRSNLLNLARLGIILSTATLAACSGAGLNATTASAGTQSSVVPQTAQVATQSVRGSIATNSTPVTMLSTSSVRGLIVPSRTGSSGSQRSQDRSQSVRGSIATAVDVIVPKATSTVSTLSVRGLTSYPAPYSSGGSHR